MPVIHNGLRCPQCGLIEPSVYFPRGNPPVCPDCGAQRVTWWGHGQPHYSPNEGCGLDLGDIDPRMRDMASTRTGLRQLQKELADLNGKRVEFETPSPQRLIDRDERRQREYDWRKSQGRDMKEWQERVAAEKAQNR